MAAALFRGHGGFSKVPNHSNEVKHSVGVVDSLKPRIIQRE